MFDWEAFFRQYHIDYVTSGPNVAKGNLGIRCPFCGASDPSHHMGVSLRGKGWGCLRNRDHRGKSPAKLVRALLGCTPQRAHEIVGSDAALPDDFYGHVMGFMADNPAEGMARKKNLIMPDEFKPIRELPSARPFIRYLHEDRKLPMREIKRLTDYYDMRYCTRGPYAGRIIFPVYYKDRLVSWTGRTIYKTVDLRYKAHTEDPEKARAIGLEPAVGPVSHYLLWYDDLADADADTICLVEGPFDALSVNVFGYREGVVATCFFTAEPTDEQVGHLHELLPRFKYKFILPDRQAEVMTLRTSGRLAGLGLQVRYMRDGLKDPGEISSTSQLMRILRSD